MQYDTSQINALRSMLMTQPAVCTERALIYTEVMKATEGQPAVLRRARSFATLLENMTLRILPGELLAGKPTGKLRGGSISPELRCEWILDELDVLSTRDTDPFQPLMDSEKAVLRKIIPFWESKSLYALWKKEVSPEALEYNDLIIGGGAYCDNNQYYGHTSLDYQMLLELGTSGIIEHIDQRLAGDLQDSQKNELEAMKICLNAVSCLANRYAGEAERLAGETNDVTRRGELKRIAGICRRVPAHPAGSYYEAVQSLWLGYMCIMIENWGTGNTFLRADQYLWPYYKRDIDAGTLKGQEAFDLTASLLVNCNSACVVYSEWKSHGFAGNNSGCSFTLGGVKKDGSCAENELSYLFLEAERCVRMGSDDLVVRIADNTSHEFLLQACDVAKEVGGKLKFVGDGTSIRNLMLDGVPQEVARDYAIAGCTSPEVGGQVYQVPGGIISLPGILELALNRGIHRFTGKNLGINTDDPAEFTNFQELWSAFEAQLRHVIPFCHIIKNADKRVFSENAPSPYQSALSPACIEQGTDIIDGGTRPYFSFAMAVAGAPNVGDSLAAIKKYVFEEHKLTMRQILDAIDRNFKGAEDVRALLLRAPKFGNNNPYVDTLVNDVLTLAGRVVEETEGFGGAKSQIAAAAVTANIGFGMVLGATPDGRLAGEPISEGGISPSQGKNDSGITCYHVVCGGAESFGHAAR